MIVLLVFFLQGSSFRTYFSFNACGVVPCGGPKSLPVHRHSADYIFWTCGIIGLILSQFENRVPLKPVLVGVGSVAQLLNINKLNNRVCYFHFFNVSHASKDLHSELIL